MGVPVLTLRGACHAHNVGASLLTAIGLEEFVASSAERYVRLAVEAACDPTRLARVRSGLRAQMHASPLCDGRAFTGRLEETFRRLATETATRSDEDA